MERPVAGQGAPLRSAGAPAEYPAPAARRAARSGIDRGFADGSTTMRGGRVQGCDPLCPVSVDRAPARTIVNAVAHRIVDSRNDETGARTALSARIVSEARNARTRLSAL